MLCLSRRTCESIIIHDNIEITILGIDRGKVKIGITAPRDVPILRRELWDAAQAKVAKEEWTAEEILRREG